MTEKMPSREWLLGWMEGYELARIAFAKSPCVIDNRDFVNIKRRSRESLWKLYKKITTCSLIFLLTCSPVFASQNFTVKEHCHKEQIITKDANGEYRVNETGETICESTPNDWSQE